MALLTLALSQQVHLVEYNASLTVLYFDILLFQVQNGTILENQSRKYQQCAVAHLLLEWPQRKALSFHPLNVLRPLSPHPINWLVWLNTPWHPFAPQQVVNISSGSLPSSQSAYHLSL